MYPNPDVASSSSTLLAYAESQANRYRGIGPLEQVCTCHHCQMYIYIHGYS